jgi:hypothetical protein
MSARVACTRREQLLGSGALLASGLIVPSSGAIAADAQAGGAYAFSLPQASIARRVHVAVDNSAHCLAP